LPSPTPPAGLSSCSAPACAGRRTCRPTSAREALAAARSSMVWMPAARSRSRCTGRIPATSSRSRWATTSASQVAHRPHATILSSPRSSPHAIGAPVARRDVAVGDERPQSLPAQPEDGHEVADGVRRGRAVAEQHSTRPLRGTPSRSSWSAYAAAASTPSRVRDARAWCPARPTGWRRHPGASGSSRTRKSANPTNSSVANTA
jgi:hypothetical protein